MALYAISVDTSDTLQGIEEYHQIQGYPWQPALPGPDMLQSLQIVQRSTKVAFDADGIVVYRAGFGEGDADDWRAVFEQLASN